MGPSFPDAGPDGDEDPGADSSDADGSADTDALIPAECGSALIPPCGETAYLLPPIVEAADFGADVRFVDANPHGILAERENEDGISMLVISRRNDSDPWSEAVTAELLLESGRPIGLAGPYPSDQYRHLALVCHPDESCQVYAVGEPYDDPIEIWPHDGGAVPAEVEARGLIGGDGSLSDLLVVYGNGAMSFYGMWDELLPPSSEPHLNGLVGMQYAVGDAGRLVTLSNYQPYWTELDSGTDEDLLSVAGSTHGIAIGAADGRLGWWDDSGDQPPYWIEIADEPIVALDSRDGDGPFSGLTDDGCAFQASPGALEDQPCVAGVLPDAGLSVLVWGCWESTNVSYLGEDGLYGSWDCLHTS